MKNTPACRKKPIRYTDVLPPGAVSVNVTGDSTILVTFSNGEVRLFDLKPLLSRKCYAGLNDQAFLSLAFIQYGCVAWPDNIDIDPDWLYEDSVAVHQTQSGKLSYTQIQPRSRKSSMK